MITFGKDCARLRGETGEQTLSLAGLAPGFYAYRVLAHGRLVQAGKVVKLP